MNQALLGAIQQQVGGDPLADLLATAKVWFKETGITGSTPVTARINEGTGGSAFDRNVIIGTGANLTRTSINGLDCVNASGGVSMETTSEQIIIGKTTEFFVFQATDLACEYILDGRDIISRRHGLWRGGTSQFTCHGGTALHSGVPFDLDLNIITLGFNQNAFSYIDILGKGSAIGDNGNQNYGFASLFDIYSGLSRWGIGIDCEYLNFNSELVSEDATLIQNYLGRWVA